ncbi:hypothetical protein Tco_0886798 [Tanacetum coccineum]
MELVFGVGRKIPPEKISGGGDGCRWWSRRGEGERVKVLTLKPLPKIDPKAKGKGIIEEDDESDTESEDINEAEKKFKMLANDEEMARKVQEEWEAEEEKKRLAEEEATKAAFTNETQLRNQMMTYLKHVGAKRHSDLKTKFFEEIQVLYEKVKRSDANFIAMGYVEDERLIKYLNKKAAGIKKDDNIKEESKEEESTKKRKLGTRKKMKSRKRRFRKDTSEDDETNSEKGNDELRLCLTIDSDEDKEVDYKILEKKYPIIEWKSEYLGNKPQYHESKDLEEINLNVVIRIYKDEIPEGLVIHLLVEKKYPLKKKVLLQMLELKLESEEDNTMALELIRFVKKLIAELEPENSDGDEEDL